MQRAERRADLDAEVLQQGAARGVARHAVGDLDRDHVVHLVRDVAEDDQAEPAHAGEHRVAVQPVPVDHRVAALSSSSTRAHSRAA